MSERDLPVAGATEARAWLWQVLRPQKWTLFASLALLVVAATAELAATRVLGVVIDAAISSEPHRIDELGVAIVALIAVATVVTYAGRRMLAAVVERALAKLREDAFRSVLRMPLGNIERAGVSDPLTRMTSDVAAVSDAMHVIFPVALLGALTLSMATVALVITSPLLALAAAVGFPMIVMIARQYFRSAPAVYIQERRATAKMVQEVHEVADGSKAIRTFGRQHTWQSRLRSAAEEQWTNAFGPADARCRLYAGGNAARAFSLVSVLTVGMYAHVQGWASVGTVSVAALLVTQLYTPLGDFLESIDNLQSATAAAARIVGLTLIDPEDDAVGPVPADGSIELHDVWFGYDPRRPVLHGTNLRIESGEKVAVVGTSGAGKSTIAKLITGVNAPDSGTIKVGGVPVSATAKGATGSTVALVTQEAHVFSGSIADNLRLAVDQADEAELWAALDTVGAKSWVSTFPERMETAVGVGGTSLTLLQSQQLALARVVLSDPLVVILDEATASFDGDAARGVERSFAAVFEGRTVVTIAHRLDVAAGADRIVVVDAGDVRSASHDDLLNTHDGYAEMWKRWESRTAG
jgi:ATP-binding cassette subfamily C protein